MAGKEKFTSISMSAIQKRITQLKEWENSETNKMSGAILPSRRTPTIKFPDTVVFLAAAHSGDTEEVERLVKKEGADVNSINKDGLTSLHQCCIDDDYNMVKTLVKLKANLDIQDKEGWTPLHAAASCGHAHIVQYLLDHGAFPALVNNEGDTPLDLAEDYDEIVEMLQKKIDKDQIDVKAIQGIEESLMLEDANRFKNDPNLKPVTSHGGATPLHVAASKNYVQVVKILLSLKASQVTVDAVDEDGWTPLHAAVYWGNFACAELLVAHGADLNHKTAAGDTVEDLVEPEHEDELNTLKKYGEQNNRSRSNAISVSKTQQTSQTNKTQTSQTNKTQSSQSKPQARLIHQNSREDMKHPSPQIVRRRSSKERSLFPKMDIAKEREERENFTAETGDVSSDSPPLATSGPSEKNQGANASPPTSRGIYVPPTAALPPRAPDKNSTSMTTTPKGNFSPPTSRGRTSPTNRGWTSPTAPRGSFSPPTARNQNVSSTVDSRDAVLDKDNSSKDSSGKNSPSSSPSTRPHLPKLTTSTTPLTSSTSAFPSSLAQTTDSPSSSTPSSRADSPQQLSPTPKSSRKKFPGMSPKMMMRVGQWETASSTSSSRSGSSSGRSLAVTSSNEDISPTRTSTASTTNTTSAAATEAASKRYSFQAKTISASSSSSLSASTSSFIPPRSLSESRSSSAGRVGVSSRRTEQPSVSQKRSSYDETNSKSRLEAAEEEPKVSSLPRGTKIAVAASSAEGGSKERKGAGGDIRVLEDKDVKQVVSTEAMATPSSQTEQADGSHHPSRRGESESNTSVRSTMDESETSRRNRARKTRQARKPTQPVPPNILEQITKHDELELTMNSSTEASTTSLDDSATTTDTSRSDEQTSVTDKQTTSEPEPKPEEASPPAARKQGSPLKSRGGTMSSYRPSARPTSRILQAAAAMSSQSTWPPSKAKMAEVVEQKMKLDLKESLIKSATTKTSTPTTSTPTTAPTATSTPISKPPLEDTPPSSKTTPTSTAAETSSSSGGASNTTPGHSRSKSNTRRRPREKRRSTGIVAPEDLAMAEDILADSEETSTQVRKAGDGLDSSPPPISAANSSSLSSESLEHSSVNDASDEYRLKFEQSEAKHEQTRQELAEAKKKIVDLNRRYQDAVRAYEQERREKEAEFAKNKDVKIMEKMLQELKQENQRMKDENSALIRVIGKLSRTPNQNQPQTRQ